MAAMRRLLPILLLSSLAVAEDIFPVRLAAFEAARRVTLEPGAQARVYPALEDLIATKDVRALAPLAGYLMETFKLEHASYDDIRETQQVAARAYERVEVLSRELMQLDLKEKAGDQNVGPAIEERVEERQRLEREFNELKGRVESIGRTIEFLQELRGRLANGCVSVLKSLDHMQIEAGIAAVRQKLDVADREQALFLVRILGDSDVAEAEDDLLEILTHPKVDAAVIRQAQYSLAAHLTRRAADALAQLWERDPEGLGAHARHVLSLAAKKRLSSLEEAREWIATLPQ